jgi:hypothetical protein
MEGSYEHGNELSGSMKCWEVLEWLHNWQLLKKGSAPYRERREKWRSSERKKERIYISGLEGSQAVPACPSGRGSAFNRD